MTGALVLPDRRSIDVDSRPPVPFSWMVLPRRLEGAKDWAVSRNRFWGTPMPMWVSDDGEEMVAVGSIAELKELSGVEVRIKLELPSPPM